LNKNEKNNLEQEQAAEGYSNNQNITTTSTNEEADKLTYKADEVYDSEKIKNLEEVSKEKTVSTKSNANSISYSKPSLAASSESTSNANNSAYYTGNELAIKEFVLTYLKLKLIDVPIIGNYKIVGTIDEKGGLKVTSITQISKEHCNCTGQIKEALNTMKKWNPAIQNGKAIQSIIEFMLMF
jgi:hypothetical protein